MLRVFETAASARVIDYTHLLLRQGSLEMHVFSLVSRPTFLFLLLFPPFFFLPARLAALSSLAPSPLPKYPTFLLLLHVCPLLSELWPTALITNLWCFGSVSVACLVAALSGIARPATTWASNNRQGRRCRIKLTPRPVDFEFGLA